MTYEEIVEAVRALPIEQQRSLLQAIEDWQSDEIIAPKRNTQPRRSLLEFGGIGAKYYDGTDAQEYVNELRREWDHDDPDAVAKSEARWDELFAKSQDMLSQMAAEARADDEAGLTEELTEEDFDLDEDEVGKAQ